MRPHCAFLRSWWMDEGAESGKSARYIVASSFTGFVQPQLWLSLARREDLICSVIPCALRACGHGRCRALEVVDMFAMCFSQLLTIWYPEQVQLLLYGADL